MTRLLLRLEQPSLQPPLPAGAMAKVQWVGQLDGSPPPRWWNEEKPIGVGRTPATVFELPDGGVFAVDVVRPRGSTISKEYRVVRGETRDESIALGASPHEYLSWHQFAGIVGLRVEDPVTPGLVGVPPSELSLMPMPTPGIHWLDDLLQYDHPGRPTGAGSTQAPPILGCHDDGRWVMWDLKPLDNERREQLTAWERNSFPAPPGLPARWMIVRSKRSADLVAIPWSWWLGPSDAPLPIQILHDRCATGASGSDPRGRTTVNITDDRWFPLLEYLASGRLAEAGTMADEVIRDDDLETALYVKKKGPLLAAAGALVLIARTTSTEPQHWDQWLDNLANWFEHIPDGKILLGCRRLRQARRKEDRETALGHLRDGFMRGVPFLSATVRMLSLALAQLGSDFDEADHLRQEISFVAARVDPEQPFTVIRI
jgi:hypothetical protein